MGQGLKRGVIYLALFLLCILSANIGQAQSVTDHAKIAPPPDWVELQDSPPGEFEAASRLKIAYRLTSFQKRVGKTEQERYRHFIMDLLTTGAVEDNGTISIGFDPGYQSIIFHHIHVVRDGIVSDRLDFDDFEIFRTETDRDKLIYNGRLTLSLSLTDLRAGDKLDYSYTVSGKNPGLGEGFFQSQIQEYASPEQRIHSILRVEDGLPVYTKLHLGAVEPRITRQDNGVTIVSYIRDDVPAFVADDDVPKWSYSYPIQEISSYDNWSDVGNVFAPYYIRSQSDEIKRIAADIRAETADAGAQARAALDYVQRNIRYLGLEMGQSGYKPRAPDLVLDRKFGDCKDVTLLLLSLLQELGVSADPMLVSTDELGGVFDALPNHAAFDHVVVLANIADQFYVMDPTRSPQLGDIDHYAQDAYGRGLLLREDNSAVIDLPDSLPEWTKDFTDSFDLISDPDTITFTNVLKYVGEQADSTVDWVNGDGMAAVEKALLDYYRDIYPTIEVAEEMQLITDEEKAIATLKTGFKIPEAWTENAEENRKTFRASPYELRADFPKFNGADRVTDFALEYPVRTRHTVEYLANDDYDFDDDKYEFEGEAFSYLELNEWNKDGNTIYRETYSYRTKKDHINLADVKTDMAAINKARDRMGMTVYTSLNPNADNASISGDWEIPQSLKGAISILLLAILAFMLRLIFRKPQVDS
ncbi:DUF3857 domain-containing protein [Litorimonas sp. WD9-15]|uniref:DUF3857 domain-containing protein n=1 Tax=Litorimonas sp. WD9-15 TaxID=3418716 RepID=UPI003CFEA1DB